MFGIRRVLTIRLQASPVHRHVPWMLKRCLSFSFTGAKKLSDIMEVEKLRDKTKTEIQDLWHAFHENQVSQDNERITDDLNHIFLGE